MAEWDQEPFPDVTPQQEAEELVNDAVVSSSVETLEQAVNFVYQQEAEIDIGKLLTSAIKKTMRTGSLRLIPHLVSYGADVKDLTPMAEVFNWRFETDLKKKQEAERRVIEILDTILNKGFDINTTESLHYGRFPLLWYVCGSKRLVQYCLDHGANVTIAGERTSKNPKDEDADIYHTERHLLLLEMAASDSDVDTFELLRCHGAPLGPGRSWPSWHAPCLLLQAVRQAALLAPRAQRTREPEYSVRISMVKYLLSIIGIPQHQSDTRTCKIVHPMPLEFSKSNIKDPDEGTTNLRELVTILFNSYSNPETLIHVGIDAQELQINSEPAAVDYLRRHMPTAFKTAFKHWQESYKRNVTPSGISSPSSRALGSTEWSEPAPEVFKLVQLPGEVISIVATLLSDADVRSFRRVNRMLRDASFPAFRTQLRCRTLVLSLISLQSLNETLSSNNHLFWHVEEVVFVLEENNPDIDTQQVKHIETLLTDCFIASKTQGNLRALTLTSGDNALLCLLSALHRSKLILRKLSLFPNGTNRTAPVTKFRTFADLEGLSPSLSNLQHLTWTLSTPGGRPNGPESDENISIIKRIFEMTPMLKTLDLGWYKRGPKKSEVYFLESCINTILAMKRLEDIKLRGIFISPTTLNKLLSQSTATRISLRYVTIASATSLEKTTELDVRQMLDILTSGRFEYFHLNDLHISGLRGSMIRFVSPATTTFRSEAQYSGPLDIEREGHETRRHIEFNIDTGRILSTGAWARYQRERSEAFGLPYD